MVASMALSEREKQMIADITHRQRQLEMILGGMIGGGLGRAGVNLYQQNPLNSPLTNLSQHNEAAANLGKLAGQSARKNLNKKKRKVSGYQKEFGRQLKKLKQKHKRTNISTLMRKAHIATRKARK
ncbi:MAG: hypothetical protein [Circular genetic element sp.]|nr:MAG: hypothetical protein [Circular genetic element sp.]